jgi:hypothetical protein
MLLLMQTHCVLYDVGIVFMKRRLTLVYEGLTSHIPIGFPRCFLAKNSVYTSCLA